MKWQWRVSKGCPRWLGECWNIQRQLQMQTVLAGVESILGKCLGDLKADGMKQDPSWSSHLGSLWKVPYRCFAQWAKQKNGFVSLAKLGGLVDEWTDGWLGFSFFLFFQFYWDIIDISARNQFSRSVVSDPWWLHELQHARPACPSPNSGAWSNSCPSSR